MTTTEPAGSSTSLAVRPVAHTRRAARLLGRRAAEAEHFEQAVEVARAWEAPTGKPRPPPRGGQAAEGTRHG